MYNYGLLKTQAEKHIKKRTTGETYRSFFHMFVFSAFMSLQFKGTGIQLIVGSLLFQRLVVGPSFDDVAVNNPHVHKWADLCCDWLRNIL